MAETHASWCLLLHHSLCTLVMQSSAPFFQISIVFICKSCGQLSSSLIKILLLNSENYMKTDTSNSWRLAVISAIFYTIQNDCMRVPSVFHILWCVIGCSTVWYVWACRGSHLVSCSLLPVEWQGTVLYGGLHLDLLDMLPELCIPESF